MSLMSNGNFKKILAAAMFCAAVGIFSAPGRAQGRLAPPEGVKCDPKHLTSFT